MRQDCALDCALIGGCNAAWRESRALQKAIHGSVTASEWALPFLCRSVQLLVTVAVAVLPAVPSRVSPASPSSFWEWVPRYGTVKSCRSVICWSVTPCCFHVMRILLMPSPLRADGCGCWSVCSHQWFSSSVGTAEGLIVSPALSQPASQAGRQPASQRASVLHQPIAPPALVKPDTLCGVIHSSLHRLLSDMETTSPHVSAVSDPSYLPLSSPCRPATCCSRSCSPLSSLVLLASCLSKLCSTRQDGTGQCKTRQEGTGQCSTRQEGTGQ